MSEPRDAGAEGLDDADEPTIWAGRLRAWPANQEPPLAADAEGGFDETVIAARGAAEPVADETVIARRSPRPAEPAADETVIAQRSPRPAEPAADETVIAQRSAPAIDPPADATVIAQRSPAPDADSTELRDATRRDAASRDPSRPAASGRARIPDAEAREIYRPRASEPVMAVRHTPVAPPPSGAPLPDAFAVQRRARRKRARMLVVAVIVGVVVVLAAVAVGVLALL